MVDSVEVDNFAHSRHTAKPCPVVDVKRGKKCLFLYPAVTEGVSDKSHKKRQKAKSITVFFFLEQVPMKRNVLLCYSEELSK